MKKVYTFLVLILAAALIAGCSQTVSAAEQKSSKPRESSPVVAQADAAALADGNGAFALNLYQSLKKLDGNLFYSPYSISEALAMTYGGARNNTEKQMAAALQFKLAQGKLHPAFNAVDIALASRGAGAKGQDEKGFRLKVVNAIWGQKGFKFAQDYLDLLAANYGAGMRIVDYKTAPDESRKIINQWVTEQTEDKIKDLLPPGSVDQLTRLVLTNAIYFNASWATRFEQSMTKDGQFTLLNGSQVSIPMMHQNAKTYQYFEGSNYQAVALPYDGRELSMVVLLPASGKFADYETALDYAQLNTVLGQMKPAAVNLSLPKFKIESDLDLVKDFKSLGMTDAFDPNLADLSGMNGKKDLYISGIVHKSYVSVDENGTEAAAATGVVVGTTSMPVDIKEFSADRPFIFLIRDNATGTILFIGRVVDPSK